MNKRHSTNGTKIIVSIIMLFTITFANAQNRSPQQPPRLPDSAQIEKMVNELANELTLTETQKVQVKELHFAHFNEAKAQMEKNKAQHEKNKETMNASRKEFEAQIGELLNDEQKVLLEEYMKNKRPPQKGNQKPRH